MVTKLDCLMRLIRILYLSPKEWQALITLFYGHKHYPLIWSAMSGKPDGGMLDE